MAFSDIDYIASATNSGSVSSSTPIVVSKPTGTVENDVMIATFSFHYTGSATNPALPSGWTQIGNIQSASMNVFGAPFVKLLTCYKVAGSSEPSTYSFYSSSLISQAGAVGISTYRGVDTSTPIGNYSETEHDYSSGAVTSHDATSIDIDTAVKMEFTE